MRPLARPARRARSTAATCCARPRGSATHDHPERDQYLEHVIEALGGEPVDYEGAHKCCGFPVITMNRETSLSQAGRHIGDAIDADADALVTPCPLCHLNLDLQQPDAATVVDRELGLPVLHLPQLVGPGARLRAEGARHEQARRAHDAGRAQAAAGSRSPADRLLPRRRASVLSDAADDVRGPCRGRARRQSARPPPRPERSKRRRSRAGWTRPASGCGVRSRPPRRRLARSLSRPPARTTGRRAVAGLVVVAGPLGHEGGRLGELPGGA